jgi:hypothetical protein
MILPTKHTSLERSFLGFGYYILKTIGDGLAIDELWVKYKKDFSKGKYDIKQSFDDLLLTLVFLFSVNAVYYDNDSDRVKICN